MLGKLQFISGKGIEYVAGTGENAAAIVKSGFFPPETVKLMKDYLAPDGLTSMVTFHVWNVDKTENSMYSGAFTKSNGVLSPYPVFKKVVTLA